MHLYFAARGHTYRNGFHIEGGQSLSSIWDGSGADIWADPNYGNFTVALKNFDWDILILQPASTPASGGGSASAYQECQRFYDFVEYAATPPQRLLLYQNLPGLSKYKTDRSDRFSDYWDGRYSSAHHGHTPNRDCFIYMMAHLSNSPRRQGIPVEIVPSSEAIAAVEKEVLQGAFPGLTSIHDFYRDWLHLNPLGRYVTSLTLYSVITGEDRDKIQSIVARVVSENHYSPDNLPFDSSIELNGENLKFRYKAHTGYEYQLKHSENMTKWTDFAPLAVGNGQVREVTVTTGFLRLIRRFD